MALLKDKVKNSVQKTNFLNLLNDLFSGSQNLDSGGALLIDSLIAKYNLLNLKVFYIELGKLKNFKIIGNEPYIEKEVRPYSVFLNELSGVSRVIDSFQLLELLQTEENMLDREIIKSVNKSINFIQSLSNDYYYPVVKGTELLGFYSFSTPKLPRNLEELERSLLQYFSLVENEKINAQNRRELTQVYERMEFVEKINSIKTDLEVYIEGLSYFRKFFNITEVAIYVAKDQTSFEYLMGNLYLKKTIELDKSVQDKLFYAMQNPLDVQYYDFFGVSTLGKDYFVLLINSSRGCKAFYLLEAKIDLVQDFNFLESSLKSMGIALERLAQPQTRLSNQYVFNMLDNVPIAVIAINENYDVHFASSYCSNLFGKKFKNVIGKNINDLFEKNKRLKELLISSKKIKNQELFYETDGLFKPISITVYEQNEGNQFLGKVIVVNDISDMKKLESELLESEQTSILGAVAAGVAHEIRNPLSSLKIFSQLMKTKHNDKEFWQTYSSVVTDEIARLENLMGDFLKLSAKKKTQQKLETITINDVLRRVINLVELQIRNSQISLTVNAPEIIKIDGDEGKLVQLFLNLVMNSVQALENKPKGEIIISSSLDDNKVLVSVKDNGVGVTKEDQDKLFDVFFSTKKCGSGLGLSISKKIVLEHKGEIRFESKPKDGTEFFVKFPLAK